MKGTEKKKAHCEAVLSRALIERLLSAFAGGFRDIAMVARHKSRYRNVTILWFIRYNIRRRTRVGFAIVQVFDDSSIHPSRDD